MSESEEFKTFIQGLLEQADIGADFRKLLTEPEPLSVFQRAFTHSSYDPVNNYEVLEYIGDGILKAVNSQYIPKRFKSVLEDPAFRSKSGTKEGLLSKIRRHLEQTTFLYPTAIELGFWEHVKGDEETKTQKRNKTLEDVMEAFIGALTTVIDENIKDGMGYMFAKKFIENQLDKMEIVITPELLDDPVTRLNELYKAPVLKGDVPGLKWGDAKYIDDFLVLPRVPELDNPINYPFGQAVFNESDNLVYISNKNDWIQQSKLPIDLRPRGLSKDLRTMTDEEKKDYQGMWYNAVIGYPPNAGNSQNQEFVKNKIQKLKNEIELLLENISENETGLNVLNRKIGGLLKEIETLKKQNATIIGQGIDFTKKNAKMKAAREALSLLKESGYEK